MKLYNIDNNYLDYVYENVDKEVLFSHTDDVRSGRANVLVVTLKYNGIQQYFAVPEKGDIDLQNTRSENCVLINSSKIGGRFSSGFIVSKAMPVQPFLLTPFNINVSQEFRRIAIEITRKETELIAKTQAHLKRLEVGEKVKFSTNIDKQLVFLDAYITLRRMGESERTIYGRSFAENARRANGKL